MHGYLKFFGGGLILMIGIAALIIMSVRECLSKYDERFALVPVGLNVIQVAWASTIIRKQQSNKY